MFYKTAIFSPPQDILLSLAKAVANTTAALVLKAKHVAASCGEPGAQGGIIACATHAALATSQLVAAAKVVAPTLDNPACKEQLNNACRQVTAAVQRLLAACEAAGGGRDELLAAADQLTDALDRLQEHANMDRNRATAYSTTTVEHVMSAYERLSAAHSQPEVLQRARELGHATATLITDIKTEAESKPSDAQRRLLAAAKLLADATARMVEAARQCATSPEDREKQEALRRAAEELRFITADYAQGQDIVRSQIARLSQSAMQTASSAGQLAAAAHSATTYNSNTYVALYVMTSEGDSMSSPQIARLSQSSQLAAAAHSATTYNTNTYVALYVMTSEGDSMSSPQIARLSQSSQLAAAAHSATTYNTNTYVALYVMTSEGDSMSSPQIARLSQSSQLAAAAHSATTYNTNTYTQTASSAGQLAAAAHSATTYNTNTYTQSSQLAAAAHSATTYNTNTYTQETLLEECKLLTSQVPRVVDAVKVSSLREGSAAAQLDLISACDSLLQGSAAAQLDLISACDSLLQPSGHAVAAARAALPTVSDAHAHKHLSDTAQQLTQDAGDLRSAVSRARTSCRGLELDAAAQLLRELPAELQQQPRPLPGQTAEWASSTLNNASRSAGAATAALVSAARAAEPAAAGAAAADLSSHLKEFTKGVRASAALAEQPEHSEKKAQYRAVLYTFARETRLPRCRNASAAEPAAAAAADLSSHVKEFTKGLRASAALAEKPEHSEKLLSSGRHVLESSLTLVETVQRYLATSETVHIQHIITTAKQLNQDLERTVEAVPAHSELDIAMENINETLNILNMNEFPPSDRNYGELQSELTTAAAELSQLSSSVAWSAETPGQLARAARGFGDQFNTVAGLALEMCRHTEDVETRTLMVNSMKTVTVNSSKLLSTAKSVSQDLNRPNAKNQLAAAARDVTDSINRLLDVCTEATPGQKECEAVLRNVAAMAPLLRAPDEPVTDLGYFCTLDQLVTHSKTLSEGMSGMAHSIKRGAQEQFSTSVQATGAALCRLLEGTAQAAYLVAVSDETSVAGRPGLVDRAQFARAAAAIDQACRVLADSSSAQQQVLSAATIIAKHTSAICNACRVASSKTSRAADKRHFVQSAKDVANCTAALVKRIKTLDADYTEENRSACAEATAPLQDAVRSLCQFADSPEFAAAPARLSPAARQQQQPILQCGRNIITASCSMIEAAKVLALSPSERAHWQALAQHSKTVSDNIKALVTNIREKAPGQRQCACALQTLSSLRRSLEQSALAEQPAPPAQNTLEGFSELIESSSTEILERLEPLRVAAKGEAENLGHAVVQMVSYIEPLVTAAIGCHAQLSDSRVSAALLDATRTVLEAAAALVQAAGDAAGNPRATSIHPEVDSSVALCRRALSELSSAARELSAARGAVRPLLDAVARSQQALTTHRMSLLGSFDETASYVDYQTRMAATAKDIARLANDMTAKSATDASRLVQLGNDVCQKYCQLAADSGGASATTPHADLAASIRSAVLELGEQVSDIIKAGGTCRMSATADNQRAVADSAKRVNEKVMSVLSALQQGSRGTQACIDAAATVAAIIGDLDTTIMFASAGTLQSDNEADSFSQHREAVLKTAKTLVEDTKRLVGGATGGQDELAAAADAAVATIVQLCEVVKQGAISLGCNPPDRQVLLLNAARDVAAALRDLAAATAAASPRQADSLHVQNLKTAAKRATKRWSLPVTPATLPVTPATLPRPNKRRSFNIGAKNDYGSCDSETDVYQSDMEDELIKLLDYSSQDDDVSPTIFHDNCEEIIGYIESFMRNPNKVPKDDDVNEKYNIAARNSLVDMDWRVIKYGENILLGEIKSLVDVYVDISDREENRRRREKIVRLKANTELDSEMKRLSQVVDDMESEIETEETDTVVTKIVKTVVTTKRPLEEKLLKYKLRNPSFKVTKVKPVNLVISLELRSKTPVKPAQIEELKTPHIEEIKSPLTEEIKPPEETNKDEAKVIEVKPEVKSKNNEFWNMFKDDTEWWQALAKRNLEKMEEARKDLERFSQHELVLGEIENEMDKYEKEKETLQTFIEDVDRTKNLEYDKKYEDMVLKLIDFAKKDFNYKGFDPLIEQLNALSKIQIERPKKVINVHEIIHMDVSKYTYEELNVLEKYYQEIIKKYKPKNRVTISDKENIVPIRSPSLTREPSPSYHKTIIVNTHSQNDLTKQTNQYNVSNTSSLNRSQSRNRQEIFDLTRSYPEEYYANNWWSIYEDILKTRERQFGSIDNWWRVYESVLNTSDLEEEEMNRIRSLLEYRNSLRKRPNSRLEEQLKMLDEVKNSNFTETEDVNRQDSESVMVTNVTSLLKTVKAVEDEHMRGIRALESTIESISQEVNVLMSPQAPKSTATPEELIRHTRLMTGATAAAVAAGATHKQQQLTQSAHLGRATVRDLLTTCKAAAFTAETEELKQQTLEAGRNAALAYRALLVALLGTAEDKAQLPELSRHVASAAAELIAYADKLKGADWVDPEDPTVIAENELLSAAASIDAAARKLDSLRPRQVQVEADENLNFDEMILSAARSIITATSALVRAASAAQRELIDQGKVARRPTSSSDDGQWSEGLISAARLVAAAAHSLVEASNALVCGAGSEERLISASRQVAQSTAQLLVACKVKADPSSESTRRLQAAGAQVIRSTDNLVVAARDAMSHEEERSLVLNRRMVGGIAQEIDARSEILRIEKELEEARGRLNAIRQAKYRLKTGDTSGDETDTDVYIGGYSSDASATPHRFKTLNSSFANTTYSPNSTHTSQHNTQNSTNLSQHIGQLNQSIHGSSSPGYSRLGPNAGQTPPTSPGYKQAGSNAGPTPPPPRPSSFGQNNSYSESQYSQTNGSFGQTKTVQSPTFSSFRPQEETPKQSYEGFTTRTESEVTSEVSESVVVKSLQLPQVRTALLVTDDSATTTIFYKREKPPPPPRKFTLGTNYETRLYDTPRPASQPATEESRFESSQYFQEQKSAFESSTKLQTPLSPKFNARQLKFEDKSEPIYSTLNKPATPKSPFDGVGQTFSEHQKSTEAIPGGTKSTEFSIKSESYQSYPKTEFVKSETRQEIKSPFATSTPSKFEQSDFYLQQEFTKNLSSDLVKVPTPEFERISSPYGKEVQSYGGPNFMEETTTEVKEIPNGTQKITTTKIYSSSPVNITTTNTKYEPVKLEGIDELSKSFDNDSKYSTLDSRFNTLESKLSSDTSRSFMRPSDFHKSEYQSSSSVTNVKKPVETREIESLDKKFAKQTIKSETIERKSVMTSSHKSQTSSTKSRTYN
ncbi:unnamed protein product [Plutella xylostella]|uniref:(diamondback moth) hypothetical protein n=1 Tax=Plutella xylostella TaxID=51655 RepID=A0A8S4FZQ6_PLUXY|nr:unnamed protein product [Plutella xylostella]